MNTLLTICFGVLVGFSLVVGFALFAGMCQQRRTDKADQGYPGMDYHEDYLSTFERGYDNARR